MDAKQWMAGAATKAEKFFSHAEDVLTMRSWKASDAFSTFVVASGAAGAIGMTAASAMIDVVGHSGLALAGNLALTLAIMPVAGYALGAGATFAAVGGSLLLLGLGAEQLKNGAGAIKEKLAQRRAANASAAPAPMNIATP